VWNGIGRLRTVVRNEIVDKLNITINAIVADPTFKEKLADLGNTALSDTLADFGRLIAAAQVGAQARRHQAGKALIPQADCLLRRLRPGLGNQPRVSQAARVGGR
jgi:hypothetical protein